MLRKKKKKKNQAKENGNPLFGKKITETSEKFQKEY